MLKITTRRSCAPMYESLLKQRTSPSSSDLNPHHARVIRTDLLITWLDVVKGD